MKTREALFTSPKVYKPTFLDRTFPLLSTAAVVAFIWIVIFFGSRSSGPPTPAALYLGFAIISLGCLLLGGLLFLGTRRVYLLTASEGLFYQSFGYSIYTPWHNVGDVRSVSYGMRNIDNLSLKHEAITEMSLEEAIKERIAVLNTNAAMRAGSSSGARFIPVGTFSGWKSGELAEEIQRYKVADIYARMREKEQGESHT